MQNDQAHGAGRTLPKGAFVLSIDTELAWGMLHRGGSYEYYPLYAKVREGIQRLTELLERYEIHATWAVVGHLFLDQCVPEEGTKHPEIVRPTYRWFTGDWFDQDPASTQEEAPYWYGKDIVESLLACRVRQEVGSHSFSHMMIGDPGCSAETFRSELEACARVGKQRGVSLSSFVFPKNSIGHLDVLAEYGYVAYRGVVRRWYEGRRRWVWRIGHKLDNFLPLAPPVVFPGQEHGMWNVAASYYYPHRRQGVHDWGFWLPIFMRTWKARRALRQAARRKGIFHMWFHPFNIAGDPPALLRGLEGIFAYVQRLREEGVLESLTMSEVAHLLDGSPSPTRVIAAQEAQRQKQ